MTDLQSDAAGESGSLIDQLRHLNSDDGIESRASVDVLFGAETEDGAAEGVEDELPSPGELWQVVDAASLPSKRSPVGPRILQAMVDDLGDNSVLVVSSEHRDLLDLAALQLAREFDSLEVRAIDDPPRSDGAESFFVDLLHRIGDHEKDGTPTLTIVHLGVVAQWRAFWSAYDVTRTLRRALGSRVVVKLPRDVLRGDERADLSYIELDDLDAILRLKVRDAERAQDFCARIRALVRRRAWPEPESRRVEELLRCGHDGELEAAIEAAEESAQDATAGAPEVDLEELADRVLSQEGVVHRAAIAVAALLEELPYEQFDHLVASFLREGDVQEWHEDEKVRRVVPAPEAEKSDSEEGDTTEPETIVEVEVRSVPKELDARQYWSRHARKVRRESSLHVFTDSSRDGARRIAFDPPELHALVAEDLDDAFVLERMRAIFDAGAFYDVQQSEAVFERLIRAFGRVAGRYPTAFDSRWLGDVFNKVELAKEIAGDRVQFQLNGRTIEFKDLKRAHGFFHSRFAHMLVELWGAHEPGRAAVGEFLQGLVTASQLGQQLDRIAAFRFVRRLRSVASFPYHDWLKRLVDQGGKDVRPELQRALEEDFGQSRERAAEVLGIALGWLPEKHAGGAERPAKEVISVEVVLNSLLPNRIRDEVRGARTGRARRFDELLYSNHRNGAEASPAELVGRTLFHPSVQLGLAQRVLSPASDVLDSGNVDRVRFARFAAEVLSADERPSQRVLAAMALAADAHEHRPPHSSLTHSGFAALLATAEVLEHWAARGTSLDDAERMVATLLAESEREQRRCLEAAFFLRRERYAERYGDVQKERGQRDDEERYRELDELDRRLDVVDRIRDALAASEHPA